MRFAIICDRKDRIEARRFVEKVKDLCDTVDIYKVEGKIKMYLYVLDRGPKCGRKIEKIDQYFHEFGTRADTKPEMEISF